jgi:uncharacterized protein
VRVSHHVLLAGQTPNCIMAAMLARPGVLVLFAAALLAGGFGCTADDASPQREGRVAIEYGGGTIWAELAVTSEERARGLSGRESMPDDEGMLFVFEGPMLMSFWMRGMLFPLDLVWIDEEKLITQVTADVPAQGDTPDEELPRYAPDTPVMYVLELNAGTAARLGLERADQLRFEIPESAVTPNITQTGDTN